MIEYRFSKTGRNAQNEKLKDGSTRKGGTWEIWGESFSSYLGDFRQADKKNRIDKVLDRIKSQESPTIVDLMSSTDSINSLANTYLRGKVVKGIAVGLEDTRSSEQKLNDTSRGISYIGGDLRLNNTWDKITKSLLGGYADLVLERGYAGLEFIPTERAFQLRSMQWSWRMLRSNGGAALLQIPPESALAKCEIPMKQWIDRLDQAKIEFQYLPALSARDNGQPYGYFILEKTSEGQILPDCRKR